MVHMRCCKEERTEEKGEEVEIGHGDLVSLVVNHLEMSGATTTCRQRLQCQVELEIYKPNT